MTDDLPFLELRAMGCNVCVLLNGDVNINLLFRFGVSCVIFVSPKFHENFVEYIPGLSSFETSKVCLLIM